MNKKEVYKIFSLSKTNQILKGKNPSLTNGNHQGSGGRKKRQKKNGGKKAKKAAAEGRRWMEVVASELFSSKVNVSPRPSESNASNVPTDPSRGRYMSAKDFGAPYGHLCKLVRKHLLGSIMANYSKVKPKVNSNLGKPKPTRKELERWKIQRAKKLQKRRGRKRKVISTKRKRLSSRLAKKCPTCGDFHFRKSCGVRDAKINLMVKQIYQKAEVIKDNMGQVWNKIDNLESAYHDMLTRVHKLQSNRVCLGLLTGTDYPGESHPHNCPCVVQREKEEKDRKRMEQRKREEEVRRKEEAERRERDRDRREKIIEARKKRFYTRMQQQQQRHGVGGAIDAAMSVRFQSTTTTATTDDDEESDDQGDQGSLQMDSPPPGSSIMASPARKQPDVGDRPHSSLFKTLGGGMNELTRLEASRRKTRLSLLDEDDVLLRRPPRQSLLLKAVEKTRRESAQDMVVMDGAVKTVSEMFYDSGGMIQHELKIEEYPFDDADTSDDVDQLSEIDEEIEDEVVETVEEKAEAEEDEVVSEVSKDEEEEPEGGLPFGEFLDLMEVF